MIEERRVGGAFEHGREAGKRPRLCAVTGVRVFPRDPNALVLRAIRLQCLELAQDDFFRGQWGLRRRGRVAESDKADETERKKAEESDQAVLNIHGPQGVGFR